jgi:hypothetical protein
MDDSHTKKFSKDLNGGLVSLVLLAVLDRSPEDLYGYDIVKRLQRANEGELLFQGRHGLPSTARFVCQRIAEQPNRAVVLGATAPLLQDH